MPRNAGRRTRWHTPTIRTVAITMISPMPQTIHRVRPAIRGRKPRSPHPPTDRASTSSFAGSPALSDGLSFHGSALSFNLRKVRRVRSRTGRQQCRGIDRYYSPITSGRREACLLRFDADRRNRRTATRIDLFYRTIAT